MQMADEVVVPGQIADGVLEQLMRFRRVPVQMAHEVSESSRAKWPKSFQDLLSCWGYRMSLFHSKTLIHGAGWMSWIGLSMLVLFPSMCANRIQFAGGFIFEIIKLQEQC